MAQIRQKICMSTNNNIILVPFFSPLYCNTHCDTDIYIAIMTHTNHKWNDYLHQFGKLPIWNLYFKMLVRGEDVEMGLKIRFGVWSRIFLQMSMWFIVSSVCFVLYIWWNNNNANMCLNRCASFWEHWAIQKLTDNMIFFLFLLFTTHKTSGPTLNTDQHTVSMRVYYVGSKCCQSNLHCIFLIRVQMKRMDRMYSW